MSDGFSELEKTFVPKSSVSADDVFELGQMVGEKYKIVSLLGRGGIGSVYRVEQVFLGQSFALKTLNSQNASDQLVRRFQNEARAASSLSHSNLVKVIDFGLLEGQQPYLVMELVEGMTLSEHLKKNGPLSLEQAVGCFTQVCLGLSYAHDQGVIHRDIKPSNVMIFSNLPFGAEGFVKVVDFGIAKLAYAEDGEAQALTTTGEVFGSPLYMSPEQCSGMAVDHRTDIYSLGCVLFEALTGTTPFVGQSALTTMMLHQAEPVPTLKEASLGKDFPPELEQIVGKMLAKAPVDRYQNLGIVANDLAQVFKGAPILGINDRDGSSKTFDQPLKISRREFQMWLILAVLGSGLIGVGIGYYLAKVQLEKNAKGGTPVFQPSKSSAKDTTARAYRELSSSALSKYEDPAVFNALTKQEVENFEREITKAYYAARDKVDKALPDDDKNNQEGLDQLIAVQKKTAANPEMARKLDASIEERMAVSLMRLGRHAEAEKHIARARSFATTLEQACFVGITYQRMAERALGEKRYKDSLNDFYAAGQIMQKVYNARECTPEMKLQARREAGNCYRCCCAISFQYVIDYKRAIQLGEKSIEILEPVNDAYLMGSAVVNLGVAYSRDNQLEPARKFLSRSEKYLVVPNLPRDAPFILACGLSELAIVENKLGNHKKAVEHCKKALKALARFKTQTKAEVKGIDGVRKQYLNQLKLYESAVAAASGTAGASAGATTGASTGSSPDTSK